MLRPMPALVRRFDRLVFFLLRSKLKVNRLQPSHAYMAYQSTKQRLTFEKESSHGQGHRCDVTANVSDVSIDSPPPGLATALTSITIQAKCGSSATMSNLLLTWSE